MVAEIHWLRTFPGLFFGVCLSASLPAQSQQDVAGETVAPIIEATATDDLTAREGEKVVVYGETAGSNKSPSGTNFVRFKGADFYLVTFKSDLEPFSSGEPAEVYEAKRIAVTGIVSIYRGEPQIKLVDPDQVRILGADEVFPPKQPEPDEVGGAEAGIPAEQDQPEPAPAVPEPPKEKPAVDWRKFFK